jgi:polar amino acid transport system substrate-binding protein
MWKQFAIAGGAIALALGLITLSSRVANAQDETLRVAIKPIEPFVIISSDGEPSGFSIDLWNAIALRAGVPFEYVEVETVRDQLDAVQNGSAEAAIAAISITREREAVVDFSYPYYKSGLQIMAAGEVEAPYSLLISTLFGPRVLGILGLFTLAVLLAAHLVWLAERKRNPDFPRAYLPGIWEGIWWATVTVFTVGYGDKTPRGYIGRIIGMVWMLFSLFLVANVTANLTAALTVNQLRGSIGSVGDLPGKTVASVDASTAARFLGNIGVPPVIVPSVDDAIQLLQSGQVQAVVYDAPVLQYKLLKVGDEQLHLAETVFNPEDYGIAFPQGSDLVEPIDQAILALVEDGTYEILRTKWFGMQNE